MTIPFDAQHLGQVCMAHDCQRIPSIYHDGSWICRYHFGRPSKNWPAITDRLKHYAKEVSWMEHLTVIAYAIPPPVPLSLDGMDVTHVAAAVHALLYP